MNEEQLDRLGQEIVDKADNFLEYKNMALPPKMIIDALLNGPSEIRSTARDLYVELSGDDPWETFDKLKA